MLHRQQISIEVATQVRLRATNYWWMKFIGLSVIQKLLFNYWCIKIIHSIWQLLGKRIPMLCFNFVKQWFLKQIKHFYKVVWNLIQLAMQYVALPYIPTSGSHDKTLMWSVNTRPFTFWCLEKSFQLSYARLVCRRVDVVGQHKIHIKMILNESHFPFFWNIKIHH